MIAREAKTGILVRADGSIPQGSLLDGKPFLHVLPRLWLPYPGLDVSRPTSVWLERIAIPALGFEDGGDAYKPSRPFPNWNYVIFGKGRKMGLYIALQEKIPDRLRIEYLYVLNGDFDTETTSRYLEVKHDQHLQVASSAIGIDCYSTEHLAPVFICRAEYERVLKTQHEESIKEFGHPQGTRDGSYFVDQWDVVTEEELKPLPNRYVSSEYFEHYEPHHSKRQSIRLTKFNAEHRQNAAIEIPPAVFLDVVQAAHQHPWVEGVLPEQHPAIGKLCEWWNTNEHVPQALKCAKTFQIWVRFRDEDEYQDLDPEVPTFRITGLGIAIKSCIARVGEHFLIVFLKGYDDLVEREDSTEHYLVNGLSFETLSLPKVEYLPGLSTLRGLAILQKSYPKIYKHYATICAA